MTKPKKYSKLTIDTKSSKTSSNGPKNHGSKIIPHSFHAIFVIPYPYSDAEDFLYVIENRDSEKNKNSSILPRYRLPYSEISSVDALSTSGNEFTLRGTNSRIRVGRPIGFYTAKPAVDDNILALAFSARYLGGSINVVDPVAVNNYRAFNFNEIIDFPNFYGAEYSIMPVKDFVSGKFLPEDRIVRLC